MPSSPTRVIFPFADDDDDDDDEGPLLHDGSSLSPTLFDTIEYFESRGIWSEETAIPSFCKLVKSNNGGVTSMEHGHEIPFPVQWNSGLNIDILNVKIDTPSAGYKDKIRQRKASHEAKQTWEYFFEETGRENLDPWWPLKRQIRRIDIEATIEEMASRGKDAEETQDSEMTNATHVYGGICAILKHLPHRISRKLAARKVPLFTAMIFLIITAQIFYFRGPRFMSFPILGARKTLCSTAEFGYDASTASLPAFALPENTTYRAPDTMDAFANYDYRNHSDCDISSLDLHAAFAPLCTNRSEFLQAFSGGGRVGFSSPFLPRDCDMRWFSTEEVCEIFGRFEKVVVVGDSMMRHVVGALNVLLRKDLGYGAVTNWNFHDEELKECFCNHQMDVKSCSVQGIFSTTSVLENDPDSFACKNAAVDLVIEMMVRFPLDPTEVARFKALLSRSKPDKPYAFVFGHGLWNDLDVAASLNWLDGILQHTLDAAPYLASSLWPRLFITPNAAGIQKPDAWLISQGDKALQLFEAAMGIETGLRGVEHLGTWNMSIQAEKYDGVHLDLKGNLVKAMGVVNWLEMLDFERW